MIIPSFGFNELPQTEEEKWQQFMIYLQKNSGIIITDYNMKEISNEIYKITKMLGWKTIHMS